MFGYEYEDILSYMRTERGVIQWTGNRSVSFVWGQI
jgi:hypothetical protein